MDNNIATCGMATEFIRMTVPLHTGGIALRDTIETQLRFYGEPLRWAITAVDGTMAQVEAVVTVAPTPNLAPTDQNQ